MISPALKERRDRLNELYEVIKKSGEVSQKKLVALVCLEKGLTKDKVLEYLEVLTDGNYIDRTMVDTETGKDWKIKSKNLK